MSEINEKNLQKLTRLLAAMDEDSLTRQEFTNHFEKVLEMVLKIQIALAHAVVCR